MQKSIVRISIFVLVLLSTFILTGCDKDEPFADLDSVYFCSVDLGDDFEGIKYKLLHDDAKTVATIYRRVKDNDNGACQCINEWQFSFGNTDATIGYSNHEKSSHFYYESYVTGSGFEKINAILSKYSTVFKNSKSVYKNDSCQPVLDESYEFCMRSDMQFFAKTGDMQSFHKLGSFGMPESAVAMSLDDSCWLDGVTPVDLINDAKNIYISVRQNAFFLFEMQDGSFYLASGKFENMELHSVSNILRLTPEVSTDLDLYQLQNKSVYYLWDTECLFKPYIQFSESDSTFELFLSPFEPVIKGSYNIGPTEFYDGNPQSRLFTLTSEDKKITYCFREFSNCLRFVKSDSSPVPEIAVSNLSKTLCKPFDDKSEFICE